jgi:hypothetical protein
MMSVNFVNLEIERNEVKGRSLGFVVCDDWLWSKEDG